MLGTPHSPTRLINSIKMSTLVRFSIFARYVIKGLHCNMFRKTKQTLLYLPMFAMLLPPRLLGIRICEIKQIILQENGDESI